MLSWNQKEREARQEGKRKIIIGTVNRVIKKQYTFSYPYFQHKFDITGKRKTEVEELVKSFIANESN